jgi:hypothetical protein
MEDEVTGGLRKLHNEELHNLYSSPSIIRVIKSRGGDGHGMQHEWGRRGMHIGYWWESQKERDSLEDQDVDGWTILKWMVGWDGMAWIDLVQDRDR